MLRSRMLVCFFRWMTPSVWLCDPPNACVFGHTSYDHRIGKKVQLICRKSTYLGLEAMILHFPGIGTAMFCFTIYRGSRGNATFHVPYCSLSWAFLYRLTISFVARGGSSGTLAGKPCFFHQKASFYREKRGCWNQDAATITI